MSQAQQKDSFFAAWRSKDVNGDAIFGSLIYQAVAGTPPAQALIETLNIINIQNNIAVPDIRVTAFNRV